jgi:hypothetical protein
MRAPAVESLNFERKEKKKKRKKGKAAKGRRPTSV